MTISGYPQRGNPILGFAGISDVDDLPYTTLSYANGPGYKHPVENGERYDLTDDHLGKVVVNKLTVLYYDNVRQSVRGLYRNNSINMIATPKISFIFSDKTFYFYKSIFLKLPRDALVNII